MENSKLLQEIDEEITEEAQVGDSEYEIDPEKEEEAQKRAQALLEAVHLNKTENISQKVANILNRYPDTRKSDITLQIRYWQEFENLSGGSISFQNLYGLERLTSIVRARAKIQNEFKLFLSDEKTKNQRKSREEAIREATLLEKPTVPLLHIYADETGLTDDYIIIGSIWVLDNAQNARITESLIEWTGFNQEENSFPNEFHFKDMAGRNENELNHYIDFFNKLVSHLGMVSFRAIAVNKTKIGNSIEDLVSDLYFRLVKMGVQHEVETGRIELPKQISYLKDQESNDNRYKIEKLSELLINNFKDNYGEGLQLNSFRPLDSRLNRLIQQADLFTGSLNRIINHRRKNPDAPRNNKDRLADHIYETLDINTIEYSIENIGNDPSAELIENDRATILVYD